MERITLNKEQIKSYYENSLHTFEEWNDELIGIYDCYKGTHGEFDTIYFIKSIFKAAVNNGYEFISIYTNKKTII